jgi:dihydroorotase
LTPHDWITIAGICVSVVLSYSVAKEHTHKEALANAEWRGKIGATVETMYRIIFKTGTQEGIAAGILNQNSPITANVEAFDQHPELLAKLRTFYSTVGCTLSDLDLLVEIEKRFGVEMEEFERAHNLKPAASLAAACYVVRPTMKLFERYKPHH